MKRKIIGSALGLVALVSAVLFGSKGSRASSGATGKGSGPHERRCPCPECCPAPPTSRQVRDCPECDP
ncbi:hypothetical protein ABZ926_02495 [Streptomyces litmocidini]|uniref:hypothetical protein n=1 Tax=Streptomyces TaxID=1883 RepID=UPI000F46CB00|nr:hypothetical protein [Streptomyces sp. PanSC19]ROQ35922.1 hypothetical protein EDD98_5002 [Streptomyces sp. PanSC19]